MTILITGATDGLGLALATLYRKRERPVVAVGRRPFTALDSLPFPSNRYLQIDLSRPDADAALMRALNALQIGDIDLVIHNAGSGFYGRVEEQTEQDIERLVELNFTRPIELTRALSHRLEKTRGTFVFVGSVAASLPSPLYATYAATKRGLEGFARGLRAEARGRYRVQVIHPGAMRTRFHEKQNIDTEAIGWESFPDVERVARRVALAIDGRKPVVTVGLANRWGVRFARHFPRAFDAVYGRRFS